MLKVMFIIIFSMSISYSQNLNIYTKDGRLDQYNVSKIDSICFSVFGFERASVTDIDGNIYKTVKIGEQWWMAENLHVAHYRNGDSIKYVVDDTEWMNLLMGACCVYDNLDNHKETYGLLYNGYALDDNRKIAPEGWHVATDEEWQALVDYLGCSPGGKLKEKGTTHWDSPNTGATNESGFSTLPGGFRSGNNGNFYNEGKEAYFWSCTESHNGYAWNWVLNYTSSSVYRNSRIRRDGYLVRCIKD